MTESAKMDLIIEHLHSTKMLDIVDGLRPDSTFRFNPSIEPLIDIYLEDPTKFVSMLKESILRTISEKRGDMDLVRSAYNDLTIKLITEDVIQMHDISSKHENTTITFDCQIIATDSPKTFIKYAVFLCPLCGTEYEAKCNIDRLISVPHCLTTTCRSAKTEIQPKTIQTDDVQTVLMQQFMEYSANNSPVILTGKLIGKNVRTSFVGQRKRITGLFRSKVDLKNNENDIFIDILCLDDLEENEPIMPSDEDIKKYKEYIEGKTDKYFNVSSKFLNINYIQI